MTADGAGQAVNTSLALTQRRGFEIAERETDLWKVVSFWRWDEEIQTGK
jgi:hypothetical protein